MCPFYVSESEKGIRCEGFITPVVASVFPDSEAKEAHEQRYCTKIEGYKRCAVYQGLVLSRYRD